jgi:hypothetical protein
LRNTSPDDPVETWLFEGVLTAIEDGPRPDWERLVAAIDVDLGAGRRSTSIDGPTTTLNGGPGGLNPATVQVAIPVRVPVASPYDNSYPHLATLELRLWALCSMEQTETRNVAPSRNA